MVLRLSMLLRLSMPNPLPGERRGMAIDDTCMANCLHSMTFMGLQVRLQAARARGGAHAGGGGPGRGAHAGLHQPRAAPEPVRQPPATNAPFAHGKAQSVVSPMRRLAFISFGHDLVLGRAGTLTARIPKGPSGCIAPAPGAHAGASEQRLCWHAVARAVHGAPQLPALHRWPVAALAGSR